MLRSRRVAHLGHAVLIVVLIRDVVLPGERELSVLCGMYRSTRASEGSPSFLLLLLLLLLQRHAKRQRQSMKKSRLPEIVRYWRHCANSYEQAQGAISWFQK
jgi:hypothetical protein